MKKSLNYKLEANKYFIYQLLFIAIFAIATPYLVDDIKGISTSYYRSNLILTLGIIAIFADTFGIIIKCRELKKFYNSENKVRFTKFFVLFAFLRYFTYIMGARIIIISYTGKPVVNGEPFTLWLSLFETLRWLAIMNFAYFIIIDKKKRKIAGFSKLTGDVLIHYSSLYYLICIWLSLDYTEIDWLNLDIGRDWSYYISGFFLFVLIYVPTTLFLFLEGILRSTNIYEKISFWLGILITAFIALTYPILN